MNHILPWQYSILLSLQAVSAEKKLCWYYFCVELLEVLLLVEVAV